MERTLGTNLRRLVELLDGDVDRAYAAAGLPFRAAYTPVLRHLLEVDSASVREIATAVGSTHSAASQTVAQMRRAGLVEPAAARDGRQRPVRLSEHGRAILPAVRRQWRRTARAARALDDELGCRLDDVVARAIVALEARPFLSR